MSTVYTPPSICCKDRVRLVPPDTRAEAFPEEFRPRSLQAGVLLLEQPVPTAHYSPRTRVTGAQKCHQSFQMCRGAGAAGSPRSSQKDSSRQTHVLAVPPTGHDVRAARSVSVPEHLVGADKVHEEGTWAGRA